MSDILVPVPVLDGRPLKGALAVLSQAAERAAQLGGRARVLLVGTEPRAELAAMLASHGAATVYWAPGDQGMSGAWVAAAQAAMQLLDVTYVLIAAGPVGLELGGRLAARLTTGVVTDVTALHVRHGQLMAERPVFRDTQVAVARFTTTPGVIVARAGAFDAHEYPAPEPDVIALEVTEPEYEQRVSLLERGTVDDPGGRLANADVIVTGGRGVGSAAAFAELQALAEAFGPDGTVGATRAVTDAHWRPHEEHIGVTGRTVAPRLYIAVGVSGAPQHRDGMQTSEYIVAINSDPRAPIFKFADLGVVTDLHDLLPPLVAAIRARREARKTGGAT